MEAAPFQLRNSSIRIFTYIDDYLVCPHSQEQAIRVSVFLSFFIASGCQQKGRRRSDLVSCAFSSGKCSGCASIFLVLWRISGKFGSGHNEIFLAVGGIAASLFAVSLAPQGENNRTVYGGSPPMLTSGIVLGGGVIQSD